MDEQKDKEKEICVLCLDGNLNDDNLKNYSKYFKNCACSGTKFHKKCFMTNIENLKQCPTCRKELIVVQNKTKIPILLTGILLILSAFMFTNFIMSINIMVSTKLQISSYSSFIVLSSFIFVSFSIVTGIFDPCISANSFTSRMFEILSVLVGLMELSSYLPTFVMIADKEYETNHIKIFFITRTTGFVFAFVSITILSLYQCIMKIDLIETIDRNERNENNQVEIVHENIV